MSNIQKITHESGQMGLFFGNTQELEAFTETHNNSRKRDLIMAAAKDYLISSSLNVPSTHGQRFKANVAAIRVLKALRGRNSSATRRDQEKLAQYCGWGAVSDVFDENNTKTLSKREQVKGLLTEDEYKSARSSTISAFYTPLYLSRGIYTMLQNAGFKSGGRIVDPAAGVGGLIAPMPKELYDNSQVTLVELDSITAEALEHLYPNATVYGNKGFEELNIKANQDLVLQNPPFGSVKVIDKNDSQLNGLTLHNYFMAKGMKVARLGGLMCAIVSTSFLDSKSSKAREIVANLAELKGAIRLPKNVFFDHSGANASVDVLLLQRSSSASAATANWVDAQEQTLPCGESYYLNNYFISNPDAILGVMEAQPGIQGKQVQCNSESKDLVGDVQRALAAHFPADIYTDPVQQEESDDADFLAPMAGFISDSAFIDVGGYAVTEDCFIATRKADDEHGNKVFEVNQEITGKRAIRIASMIKVKQAMNELLQLERSDANEMRIETTRQELNSAYDAFVKQNGYFQETANRRAFGKDPFYPNLASLEVSFNSGVTRDQAKRLNIPAVKPSAKKAVIFSSRVIKPWTAPTTADNATDALWVCWNDQHNIDLPRVAALCGQTLTETKRELVGSLIYLNPQTAKYEFAETYLSGDVKSKLEVVNAAIKGNSELLANYNALKEIQPVDIPAIDINVEMNAGWLPAKVVTQFITNLLSCQADVEHVLGQWFVRATCVPSLIETQQFGIEGYPASKIISRMMAGRDLIVRKTRDGISYIDKEATVQVEAIANEIMTRFEDWIWSCDKRRTELEALYNEKFNRYVKPKYSGEMLAFPDMNSNIELRKHQKTCVRRSLEQGSLLLDMAVGAGKTFTFACICHEWHRLGLKERTAVVLPNHLVEAIAIEWLSLYPTEQLLILSPEDMSAQKRRETLNRIKTGSKIVLIPESTFKAIPLPYEAEKQIIHDEIEETSNAIAVLSRRFSVKKLETKLQNLEYKLDQLTNREAKDERLDFAELGFDSIIVDEAHHFKNLRFSTVALSNVRGIGNPDGSQRAWDLFCKIQYLNQSQDHTGVVFSTGTPISNSIIELWSIQKFLAFDQLKANNLHWLDSWADLFTTSTSEFEIDATGSNFKPVSRLRSFENLPEIQNVYGCLAETVTKSELNDYLPKLAGGYNMIPPVVGGKPQTVFVDPSDDQKEFINSLVERAKDFKASDIDNDNMLLLMYHARCASLDLRMLNPSITENSNSKAVACADRVAALHRQYEAEKGTQIVFCDLSTPNKGKERQRAKIRQLMKDANSGDENAQRELEEIGPDQVMAIDSSFSVYDNIKQLLIERGVAEHEIAFAQDYRTPKAKAELYLQINSGVKRVVLASTALMGTGANVNRRAVAVHHLDPTYKPSDMEQRTGRVERQGNELYESNPAIFEGVHVLYYATRNSLDSFLYQMLETKSNWIEAFRSCKTTERSIRALSGDSVTFAEIKAEISGNPLVLEHLQLTKEINKLTVQHKRHQQQQHQYEDSIFHYTNQEKKQHQSIKNIESDIALYAANKLPKGVFNAVVSGFDVDKFSTAAELLKHELTDFASNLKGFGDTQSKVVMRYCGFEVSYTKYWGSFYVTVSGQHDHEVKLSNGVNTSENSILYSVVNLLKDLEGSLTQEQRYLKEVKANLSTAKSQIGRGFEGLESLIDAKRRLTEIKHELMSQEDATDVKQAA